MGRYPDRVANAVLIEPGFLNAAGRELWEDQSRRFKSGLSYWRTTVLTRFRTLHITGPDPSAPVEFLIDHMVYIFANHPQNPNHCGARCTAPSWRYGAVSRQMLGEIGARDRYTRNLGCGLLGEAMAISQGRPYLELSTEKVITPLGLADTTSDFTNSQQSRFMQPFNTKGKPVALCLGWLSLKLAPDAPRMLTHNGGTAGSTCALYICPETYSATLTLSNRGVAANIWSSAKLRMQEPDTTMNDLFTNLDQRRRSTLSA